MVSGAVVYLALNKEKSALSVSKGMIEEIANKVSVLLSKKDNKSDDKKEADNSQPSISDEHSKQETADTSGSALTLADSSVADTIPEEQIVIRKDELLETRTVEVIELTPDQNIRTKADSLLEKASGIKSDKRTAGSTIMYVVEFWRSPVNYRGYKMGKNKLVLYGLDNINPIQLYKYNGGIFLKHEQSVFKIDVYNDYRAFERIADPSILSVFNEQ